MKKTNSFIKNRELLTYVAQNRINLDKKTLQLLANSEKIEKQYFNLFTLSPRIINFCLKNSLVFDPTIYTFVMGLTRDYDEATVYRYLKEVLYQPDEVVINAMDNRIPKLGGTDYVALMANLSEIEDINLAYRALKHPMLRDKSYYDEIANFATDSFKRKSLTNKVKTLDDAIFNLTNDVMSSLTNILDKTATVDQYNLIRAFFEILIYYEDFTSIKYFLHAKDIIKYQPIFEVVIQVRNIDEFNAIRRFMIMIVNYINQKRCVCSGNDLEWLEMRENDIPRLINKSIEEYYKKGYLHICTMLEKMNESFASEKEKPYVRHQNNCK